MASSSRTFPPSRGSRPAHVAPSHLFVIGASPIPGTAALLLVPLHWLLFTQALCPVKAELKV